MPKRSLNTGIAGSNDTKKIEAAQQGCRGDAVAGRTARLRKRKLALRLCCGLPPTCATCRARVSRRD